MNIQNSMEDCFFSSKVVVKIHLNYNQAIQANNYNVMATARGKTSNWCFYFYGPIALSLSQDICAQSNRNYSLRTSPAERTRMNAYALRILSVDRCFAMSNVNTNGDVTEQIVKL